MNAADKQARSPFDLVFDMERPLNSAEKLFRALCFLAETFEDEEAEVISELATLGLHQCQRAQELLGKLSRLTHPNRAYFEKEGWPGDKMRGTNDDRA